MDQIPSFLDGYQEQYRSDPRAACLKWFREARYGLFLHFGLYSLLGRHEWVQFREKIRVADYANLASWFSAGRFDAGHIADLAVAAGMKYINLTTRHHDSFSLWPTGQSTFHTLNSPCGRDLVGELSQACQKRGLGLCLYYSHGRDWKHPHAPNNDEFGGGARPVYDPAEPTYATGAAHDLQLYVDFMSAQITELLTGYGPIAAIWLDGIAVPKHGPGERFHCQQLYDLIHGLQPQVLVSYKQGFTGTEDFLAPEEGWEFNPPPPGAKPWEVCGCMSGGWGYTAGTPHRDAEEVWKLLGNVCGRGGNLLLNTGPLPDGSIDAHDEQVLRQVGKRLSQEGFPAAGG